MTRARHQGGVGGADSGPGVTEGLWRAAVRVGTWTKGGLRGRTWAHRSGRRREAPELRGGACVAAPGASLAVLGI